MYMCEGTCRTSCGMALGSEISNGYDRGRHILNNLNVISFILVNSLKDKPLIHKCLSNCGTKRGTVMIKMCTCVREHG
jgi:hypothetical protein